MQTPFLDTAFWLTAAAILGLLLMSGFFSGSETALTAASRAKLRNRADKGEKGAEAALNVTEDSERLIGAILLGKDAWKDELLGSTEGLEIMKTLEEAEEDFMDPSLADPVVRLDRELSIINRRARAFVRLIDFLARHKKG